MDDEQMKAEFYDVVDEFVHLANKLGEKYNTTRISSVLMFAAARYNTFNFFVTDGNEENEKKATDYYCEQYRLMLQENFEETRHLYSQQNEED